MLVQAKKAGYYNGVYYNAGQTFTLKDKKDLSKAWMVSIQAKKASGSKPEEKEAPAS